MSHIASVAVVITDLTALRKAAEELGGVWMEGQQTYKWYGVSVGDTPLPKGFTKDMLGKCQHAIKVPGVNYEVGVVRLADGTYTLAYDYYGEGGAHDGHKLMAKFGEGCKKLSHSYSTQKTMAWARNKGYTVQRKSLSNGQTELNITGIR